MSCPLTPGLGAGIRGFVFLFVPKKVRESLRPKEAGRGLGLAAFCLVNTWAWHWLTSNPGHNSTSSTALWITGPEVLAADPNKHQAIGSDCYPTARRPLNLAAPAADGSLSRWLRSGGPCGPAHSIQKLQVRRGRGKGRRVRFERSGLG